MAQEKTGFGQKPATAEEKKQIGYTVYTQSAVEANRLINKKYEQAKAMEMAGNPVAWLYYAPPHEILQCFDVLDVYPENYGATSAMREKTSPYLEYAEELGLSTNTCSYLRIAVGHARAMSRGESTKDAPYGGLAKPNMFMTTGRMCDPRIKVFDVMRRYLADVPVFMYDYQGPPCEDIRVMSKEQCEHYLDHIVEGLKGMIAFLEKHTGKKLDWNHFAHVVKNSVEMWYLFYDITQLRKHTPTPMPTEDLLLVQRPFLDMTGEDGGVEYFKFVKKEVEGRIAKNISVVPGGEKYRVLWLGLPTWLDMGIFNYLENKAAVSVMETIFHPYTPLKVDFSDPLRALATKWFWGWDQGGSNGTGIRCGPITGENHIRDLVKEYNVDGVIAHSVMSCRAVSIGQKHAARVLREEDNIPVLLLESDMSDPRSYSKTEAREKVDAFIQILEGRK